MTEKNKLDENQIWTMVMTLLPVVILMNAGDELTNHSGMRVLYAGVFGGIGAIIGFAANDFTKDKPRLVKILTSSIIILSCGLTLFFLSSKPTDAEILDKEWTTQKIGQIEFDSPTKLERQTSEIPDADKWFYSQMNLYSDQGKDRITSFLETRFLVDTISIENAYSTTLEAMLNELNINLDDVELEISGADYEEVSASFSFLLNGEKVNGYGFMYMNKDRLESLWLIPLERGFSKDYIEEFEAGIFLDYQ